MLLGPLLRLLQPLHWLLLISLTFYFPLPLLTPLLLLILLLLSGPLFYHLQLPP